MAERELRVEGVDGPGGGLLHLLHRCGPGLGRWVFWQPEQAGYSVIVQAWDFEPGDNFVARTRDAAVGWSPGSGWVATAGRSSGRWPGCWPTGA